MNEYSDFSSGESADGRLSSCFFTGHRILPSNASSAILSEIKRCVSYLYSLGVRSFHAGGALGFDTLAATAIIDMRRYHSGMTLELDLPYRNQDEYWKADDQKLYRFILESADYVTYAFDGDSSDKKTSSKYLLMRNRKMADSSAYCIAYYSGTKRGGTSYTVSYAKNEGCEIFNVADTVGVGSSAI